MCPPQLTKLRRAWGSPEGPTREGASGCPFDGRRGSRDPSAQSNGQPAGSWFPSACALSPRDGGLTALPGPPALTFPLVAVASLGPPCRRGLGPSQGHTRRFLPAPRSARSCTHRAGLMPRAEPRSVLVLSFLLQKVGVWGHACFSLRREQVRFSKLLIRSLTLGERPVRSGLVHG